MRVLIPISFPDSFHCRALPRPAPDPRATRMRPSQPKLWNPRGAAPDPSRPLPDGGAAVGRTAIAVIFFLLTAEFTIWPRHHTRTIPVLLFPRAECEVEFWSMHCVPFRARGGNFSNFCVVVIPTPRQTLFGRRK